MSATVAKIKDAIFAVLEDEFNAKGIEAAACVDQVLALREELSVKYKAKSKDDLAMMLSMAVREMLWVVYGEKGTKSKECIMAVHQYLREDEQVITPEIVKKSQYGAGCR